MRSRLQLSELDLLSMSMVDKVQLLTCGGAVEESEGVQQEVHKFEGVAL